ncbi:hypothetical protein Btru_013523 [Bulinus truncatus]|nr:hypothetical protein Btru_013523 [Bulinus truncatus]
MSAKHNFSVLMDKQIQTKLFEADDDLTRENIISMASSYLKPKMGEAVNLCGVFTSANLYQGKLNAQKIQGNGGNICGWLVNPRVTFRKTESVPPPKSKWINRNYDKDILHCTHKQLQNEYVFHHYSDSKRYIEQYRRENTSCSFIGSAGRYKHLEQRSFYDTEAVVPHDTPPLIVQQMASLHSLQLTDNLAQNKEQAYLLEQLSPSSHISSKRENQRNIISAKLYSNLQKHFELSQNLMTLETSMLQSCIEKDSLKDKLKICSPEINTSSTPPINIVSLQKNIDGRANLQCLPNSSGVSVHCLKPKSANTRCPKDTIVTYQFIGHKIGSQSANQLRPLEPCVSGGEKQFPLVKKESDRSTNNVQKNMAITSDVASEFSEENDIRGPISTDDSRSKKISSGMRNRNRAMLESRCGETLSKPCHNGDFDIILTPAMDSKLDYGYKISLQEFLTDSYPLLKAQAYKLDISPNLNDQAKQRYTSGSSRKKIFKSKPLGSGYQRTISNLWNSTDSGQPRDQTEVPSLNVCDSFPGKVSRETPHDSRLSSAPYFKFWSASMPLRSSKSRNNLSHEQTLHQLTEWIIADEESTNDELANQTKKALEEEQKHSSKSGFSPGVGKDVIF